MRLFDFRSRPLLPVSLGSKLETMSVIVVGSLIILSCMGSVSVKRSQQARTPGTPLPRPDGGRTQAPTESRQGSESAPTDTAPQPSDKGSNPSLSVGSFSSQKFTYKGSDLSGRLGQVSGTKREVAAGSTNIGHFVFGPYAAWPEGDARASFQLNLDIVNTNDIEVAVIDVYDATAQKVVASRTLSRRDFADNNRPQDFDLFFSTRGLGSHKMETRVDTRGSSYIAFHQVAVEVDADETGTPRLVNQSDASDAHVLALVQSALQGMGFRSDTGAPSKNDIVFAGQHYIAWIDQTGFVGKMNGLWKLNGASGNKLDFVLLRNGRPVNFFIPGESGDGAWGGTYVGAEHYELPSDVPEFGNLCAPGSVCNWFAYNEAPPMIPKTPGEEISNWRTCNWVKPGFHKLFSPITLVTKEDGLEIWYEEKLVKMSDGSLPLDGTDCGFDFLFPDGQRRPLYLQTGYRLYSNSSTVDRLYRYRNPVGNPTFSSKWSLIGGFVITDLNNKIPEKSFYNFFRWTNELESDGRRFPAKEFVPLVTEWPKKDVVIGWAQSSYVASREARIASGLSIGLSHPDMGRSTRQEDIGTCICVVHGGFEMGGGVLSEPTGAIPLSGGATSVSNTRRLWLPTTAEMLPDWQ